MIPLTLPLLVLTTRFCLTFCWAIADTTINNMANNINTFFIVYFVSLMQKYENKMKIEN